jgi:hypothetical protein
MYVIVTMEPFFFVLVCSKILIYVYFISDRMSYIILRGRWCNIIMLNVHAPTEDKIDDIRTGSMKN